MNGTAAKSIWESAAEPARRELAKMRKGDLKASFRFACMVELLGALRCSLVHGVTRGENGVLSEITSEFVAMEREVKKGEME